MKTVFFIIVLIVMQAVSITLAASTRDGEARLSADLSGIWTVEKPRDWIVSYIWLYADHRYILRDTNCHIVSQGTWTYSAVELVLTSKKESVSLMVWQVPQTWSMGEQLIMNKHKVIWEFMMRDTTLAC